MSAKIVHSPEATGWNMSLHPAGPKWDIRCGQCLGTFQARVGHISNPTLRCPYCGTMNVLNIEWVSGP